MLDGRRRAAIGVLALVAAASGCGNGDGRSQAVDAGRACRSLGRLATEIAAGSVDQVDRELARFAAHAGVEPAIVDDVRAAADDASAADVAERLDAAADVVDLADDDFDCTLEAPVAPTTTTPPTTQVMPPASTAVPAEPPPPTIAAADVRLPEVGTGSPLVVDVGAGALPAGIAGDVPGTAEEVATAFMVDAMPVPGGPSAVTSIDLTVSSYGERITHGYRRTVLETSLASDRPIEEVVAAMLATVPAEGYTTVPRSATEGDVRTEGFRAEPADPDALALIDIEVRSDAAAPGTVDMRIEHELPIALDELDMMVMPAAVIDELEAELTTAGAMAWVTTEFWYAVESSTPGVEGTFDEFGFSAELPYSVEESEELVRRTIDGIDSEDDVDDTTQFVVSSEETWGVIDYGVGAPGGFFNRYLS